MKISKIFFICLSFLFPAASYLEAQQQSGQIHGVVTDVSSGDVLIGANITVKGTSLGAPSDVYGAYVINAIPPGSYTLVVRYIGYKTKEMPIEVQADAKIEQNFSLTGEAIEGEEVVITAQARGQHSAINQQLSSNTIMNIVSSDKIRELPDQSAAAALSRLPGVSLMNGDQIVIRGMQAKNNVILVNGIQLPSTDLNTRSVNLGFISSNMLSGIEVIKSITPDMDANTIGGTVNLRLMEAPKDFHVDVMAQGNYNAQDRTTDNYKFWASVSDRFLDNKLGVFVQANADRSDAGNDQTSAGYTLFAGEQAYGFGSYQMNNFTFIDQANIVSNIGGSVILDYVLPQGKIVFQNTLAHTVSDNTAYRYYMDFTANALTYTLNRDKYKKELVINALQTEYNFGTVKTELTLSHSYSDKNTDLRYGDAGDNFGFKNQTDGHPFIDANGNKITYDGQRQTLTPEDVYNIQIDPTDSKNAKIADWATTRGEAFKQHLYNSTLDVTVPASFTEDVSAKFKVGGKFSRSTRSNDLEEMYKRTGDDDFYYAVTNFFPNKVLDKNHQLLLSDIQNTNYTRGQYFLESTYNMKYVIDRDQMDIFLPLSSTSWTPGRHKTNSERYDFNGAEIFSAGYAMGNFSIGSRLTLIGGVRFEHYNMDYKANFVYVTHSVDGLGNLYDTLNTVNRNDDNVLPNVQLRYKITDWADIRLAYTNSLSRPDFQAILPNVYYSSGESAQAGNTKLKPALSKNYDANVSFYNNEIGLFTVGGFYKNIDNVFFAASVYYKNLSYYNVSFPDSAVWRSLGVQLMPSASDQISTYVNNPNPAHIKGIEIEWQTNFWYLPRPFNALVLNINYTRVWSDMDYLQIRNVDSTYQEGRFIRHKYITFDTVRNARLLNQSDHVLNVALGVDYKGFSGRVSFNLQSNVITSVGARPETDQFTGNIYRWDLALQQKLPVEGLSVAFNIQNLSHSPIKTYQRFSRSNGGQIGDNLVTTIYGPTNYQLNLRYSL